MDVETKLAGRKRRFDSEKGVKWRGVMSTIGTIGSSGLSAREFCRQNGVR